MLYVLQQDSAKEGGLLAKNTLKLKFRSGFLFLVNSNLKHTL